MKVNIYSWKVARKYYKKMPDRARDERSSFNGTIWNISKKNWEELRTYNPVEVEVRVYKHKGIEHYLITDQRTLSWAVPLVCCKVVKGTENDD